MAHGSEAPVVSAEQQKVALAELGKRIKTEREHRGIKQSELADALGISKTHLYQIERGANHASARLLARVEDTLQIEPGEFFKLIGRGRPMSRKPLPAATISLSSSQDNGFLPESDERIIRVSEGFPTDAFAKRIHKTQKTIDIMTAWIGDDLHRLQFALLEALGRGVVIHIILTHPDQSHNIPHHSTTGLHISRSNLVMLSRWYRRWETEWDNKIPAGRRERGWSLFRPWDTVKGNMEVRILPTSPSIQYFRFDSDAVVGFFLQIEHSRQGPQLEISLYESVAGSAEPDYTFGARTLLGRTFTDEFEDIWGRLEHPRFHYALGENHSDDLAQLGKLDELYRAFNEQPETV